MGWLVYNHIPPSIRDEIARLCGGPSFPAPGWNEARQVTASPEAHIMSYEQKQIIIPNTLYGDQTVTAYCRAGLAAFRQQKRWQVVHVASGMSIGGGRGGDRRTRKGAFAIMDALLETPVEWSRPYEEIRNAVTANKTAIMLALSECRNQ